MRVQLRHIVTGTIVLVVGLLIGSNLLSSPIAAAEPGLQTSSTTLSDLLNSLWTRVIEEQTSDTSSDFSFTISFNNSLSGIGGSVTLGQGLNNLQITEIGADYFCLARVFSRASNIDCVPFSNINKLSYQEDTSG